MCNDWAAVNSTKTIDVNLANSPIHSGQKMIKCDIKQYKITYKPIIKLPKMLFNSRNKI